MTKDNTSVMVRAGACGVAVVSAIMHATVLREQAKLIEQFVRITR